MFTCYLSASSASGAVTSRRPRTPWRAFMVVGAALALPAVALLVASTDVQPRAQESFFWRDRWQPMDESPERAGHTVVFDHTRSKLFLFGGIDRSGQPVTEARLMLGTPTLAKASTGLEAAVRWAVLRANGGAPSPRYDHASVFDSSRARLVVVGGRDASGPFESEVFVFDPEGNSWASDGNSSGPDPRFGHAAAYDPGGDRLLLYGGIGDTGQVFDDLWQFGFADQTWVRLQAPDGPGPRYGHSMSAGGLRNSQGFAGLALFGGSDGCTVKGDVWVLGPTQRAGGLEWREVHMDPGETGPGPRVWPASGGWARQLYVVGGLTEGFRPADTDTVWTLQIDEALATGTSYWWRPDTVGGPPSPRFGATLTRVDQTAVPGWLFSLVGGHAWFDDGYAPGADSWAYLWPQDPPAPYDFTPPPPTPTPQRTPLPTLEPPVRCPTGASPTASRTPTSQNSLLIFLPVAWK